MKKKSILFFIFCSISTIIASQTSCFRMPSQSRLTTDTMGNVSINYGDLNTDGQPDLIVTNLFANKASIFLQSVPGSFSTPTTFTLLANPISSALGDFNNDGALDFVTSYLNTNTVTIQFGNGAGSFTTSTSYSVSIVNSNTASIVIGDYNNDTNLDIGLAASSVGTLLLLGNGNGTFISPNSNVVIPENKYDFTNDGIPDMISYTPGAGTFSIFPGLGGLSFGAAITTTVFLNPSYNSGVGSIGTGDINNDGNLDVIIMQGGVINYNDKVTTMFGAGNGSFTISQNLSRIPTSGFIGKAWVDDLNNDLQKEIIMWSGDGGYSIFPNLGSGTYNTSQYQPQFQTISGNQIFNQVLIFDVDGDMYKDVVYFEFLSKTVIINYSKPYSYIGTNSSTNLVIADMNNDSINEIVTCAPNNGLVIFENDGNGFYRPGPTNSCVALPIVTPVFFDVNDFNNDGYKDIVMSNASTINSINGSTLTVLLSTGTNSFNTPATYTLGSFIISFKSGDMNNDGNLDLVAVTGNSITIMFGNTIGSFTSTIILPTPSLFPSTVLLSDLNNDSYLDILVNYSYSNYFTGITEFIGSSSGTFSSVSTNSLQPGHRDIGYINNDNILDIVNLYNDTITVLIGNGTGGFNSFATYPCNALNIAYGGPYYFIKLFDLNLDGFLDLLIGRAPIKYFMGNGMGSFIPVTTNSIVPDYFSALATGDLNNDGLPDLLSDNMNILLNTTSFITPSSSSFSICSGSSLTLSGPAGAFGYTWSPGGVNTSSIAINSSGSYSLITVNNNNCISYSNPLNVSLTILPNPIIVAASQTVCIGTSTVLNASGASTYSWSTGASTSTISVMPPSSTIYTVSGIDVNGCASTQTLSVTVNTTCANVWPGDANSDGQVNNLDILELGFHYALTGPARSFISNSWQSYYANNWAGMVTNGDNVNHSDCDGSGTIDLNDTLAIFNNYGSIHSFRATNQASLTTDLSIIANEPYLQTGQWGSATIYAGNSSNPIININGLAYTLIFNQNLIETDSIFIDYPVSFLNVITQNLDFRKKIFSSGLIYSATTHTNNINANGFGPIALLYFKVRQNLSSDSFLTLSLDQAYKSAAPASIFPLTSNSCSIQLLAENVGLKAYGFISGISVFPNPTQNQLTISGLKQSQRLELISPLGQILLSHIIKEEDKIGYQLDICSFEKGIYFVKILSGDEAIISKKIIKN